MGGDFSFLAQRSLVGQDGRTLDVVLGIPQQFEPGDPASSWLCPFRITGLDGDGPLSSYGGGVDGIQALVNALALIGDLLDSSPVTVTFYGLEHHGFLSTSSAPVSPWLHSAADSPRHSAR